MFTGLIEEIGKVVQIRREGQKTALTIQADRVLADAKQGDSIAINGVCLTAAELTKNTFRADVMQETLARSSLGALQIGSPVNLERAMAAGGRFAGHIVTGHIDGLGHIRSIRNDGSAIWYEIAAEEKLLRYIVEKGSVALDGISLTVARVEKDRFFVSTIPHTRENTILPTKRVGSPINIECDVIGKYVERLLAQRGGSTGITKDFLAQYGF